MERSETTRVKRVVTRRRDLDGHTGSLFDFDLEKLINGRAADGALLGLHAKDLGAFGA